jgi:hypothetical protein
MRVSCQWTKTVANPHFTKELIIYDAGNYVGFLLDDDWKCWRVISRKSIEDTVEELLEEMPADWVPQDILSKELYACSGSLTSGNIQIPGWNITLNGAV